MSQSRSWWYIYSLRHDTQFLHIKNQHLTSIKFRYHDINIYQRSEGIRTVIDVNITKMSTYQYHVITYNINTSKHSCALNILEMHSLSGTYPHAWSEGHSNQHNFTISCCLMLHETSMTGPFDIWIIWVFYWTKANKLINWSKASTISN